MGDRQHIDCSFTNADIQLAALSGHFCPQLLINDIREMPIEVEFLISHLKPGQEELIMRELRHGANWRQFDSLKYGAKYVFETANASGVEIAPPIPDRPRKTSIKIRLEKGRTKKIERP